MNDQKTATDLGAVRKVKAQLADAHELMAETHRRAKRLVETTDAMLDVLTKPSSQHALDHASSQFYRAARNVLEAADTYTAKYIIAKEKTNGPDAA